MPWDGGVLLNLCVWGSCSIDMERSGDQAMVVQEPISKRRGVESHEKYVR